MTTNDGHEVDAALQLPVDPGFDDPEQAMPVALQNIPAKPVPLLSLAELIPVPAITKP